MTSPTRGLQCERFRSCPPRWRGAWLALLGANPALASPFFRPEFTDAVATARTDVELAVFLAGGVPTAFFPFQRIAPGVAEPVGAPLNDFQGIVAAPDWRPDPRALLQAAGLARWSFDHLPVALGLRAFARSRANSPIIDLGAGLAPWKRERPFVKLRRLGRKLEREVGPLRFDLDCRDPAPFERLLALKRAQYVRTGGPTDDLFADPRHAAVVRALFETRGDGFAGTLSALWAGDRLVAAHFGLRAGQVLHWWFPAYEPAFARYSPGLLSLLGLIEAAADAGLERIDLGKGDEPYKLRFANGAAELAEGCLDVAGPAAALERELANTRARCRELAAALACSRGEATALRASWSWRLTAPLRHALDRVQAVKRGRS